MVQAPTATAYQDGCFSAVYRGDAHDVEAMYFSVGRVLLVHVFEQHGRVSRLAFDGECALRVYEELIMRCDLFPSAFESERKRLHLEAS